MAWIFGSQRTNTPDPVAVGLRVQSSLQGVAIPIGCGRARWSGNLIDYAGFVATPQKSPGSKGGFGAAAGKGNTGQYNYSVSGLVSLGEGGVLAFNRIHNGNNIDFLIAPTAQELTDLNNIGINPTNITTGNNTYHAIYHYGNWTDAPDSWWTSNYPSLTPLAYPGQAYVEFPNLGLGSSPSFPSFSFDCTWTLSSDISALGPDANPSDWINAFLTNADWGVQGFPSSAIGDFATAKNYWRANGMMVSVALTSQTAAQSHLKELIDSLNADFRWSNGKLDIVPYGDVAVTGNGYTYTPNTTPIYNLGVNDFLPNQGSLGNAATSDKVKVAHSRADASQIPNIFQVEYLDRKNLYNPVTIYHSNDANITISGKRRYGDKKSQHWFCLAGAASVACALQLHRAWTTLNTYQWTVGRQFILLDVLDIVTITEPALQLSNQLVRLTEIQENSDGTLTMTAEEVPLTASAPVYYRQPSIGLALDVGMQPGSVNTPIFYEPPDQLGTGNMLWVGICGQSPGTFGGCEVWLSTDNDTYTQIGSFQGHSRMGVLTSSITSVTAAVSGVTMDATNTPGVSLSESIGSLESASVSATSLFATAFVVDNEVMAYQTATLTGTYAYTLSTLARGGYGSSIAAHASGAAFLRLDGNVFEWQFDASYIGKTIYLKFLAFNPFGNATQNLSDVGPYTYVVKGLALGSPLPNITNLYTNFNAGFQNIWWDEVSDFRSGVVYEIRQGSTWSGAVVVATQAHPPFLARGTGTFWIAAKCNPIAGLTVYSSIPASIVVSANALAYGSVALYDEQANGWLGTKSNVAIQGTGPSSLLRIVGTGNILAESNVLADTDVLNEGAILSNTVCYYTSQVVTDLGYVAQAFVNATMTPTGAPLGQNILSVTDFLSMPDVLGSASAAFVSGWVEVRISQDASTWGAWQKFVPGTFLGRRFQLRLALITTDPHTIAYALAFSWQVQLPPRIDHLLNLYVPSTGLAITFQPDGAAVAGGFNFGPGGASGPYVSVNNPQGLTGDTYAITGLTLTGMTLTFYNAAGTAVARSGVSVEATGY